MAKFFQTVGVITIIVVVTISLGTVLPRILNLESSDSKNNYQQPQTEVTTVQKVEPSQADLQPAKSPSYVAPVKEKPPAPAPVTKVPVVLSHNGATVYCLPEGANAVRDASSNLNNANNDQVDCFRQLRNQQQSCVSSCGNIKTDICFTDYYASFGYSSKDDCVTKRMKEGTDCIDNCYQGNIPKLQNDLCVNWNKTYTDSLNSLVSKYCN